MSEEQKEPVTSIDETKPQILWQGNTMLIVLPVDKMARAFARGVLREAEDMLCMKYMEIEAAKTKIITPSTGIKGKLARVFGK